MSGRGTPPAPHSRKGIRRREWFSFTERPPAPRGHVIFSTAQVAQILLSSHHRARRQTRNLSPRENLAGISAKPHGSGDRHIRAALVG